MSESGGKLFSKAFLASDAPLTWDVPDESEIKGRATLFTATFSAFRNARMHRELRQGTEETLREFLLVNELFSLERSAKCFNDSEGSVDA